ncbi:hypothetical protein EYF80_055128 [Liparis tanakae]|uniref:Uncharacterized protein n=1 Tax=Liparis tanakae TaxID=230148 RepID=A0A4Z2F0H9_9TELE|nr:hypothetical protein EYF80_055128 [Liparis tanakae]
MIYPRGSRGESGDMIHRSTDGRGATVWPVGKNNNPFHFGGKKWTEPLVRRDSAQRLRQRQPGPLRCSGAPMAGTQRHTPVGRMDP